jgi:hypothetical protein
MKFRGLLCFASHFYSPCAAYARDHCTRRTNVHYIDFKLDFRSSPGQGVEFFNTMLNFRKPHYEIRGPILRL